MDVVSELVVLVLLWKVRCEGAERRLGLEWTR
jgi:hypothetical protein